MSATDKIAGLREAEARMAWAAAQMKQAGFIVFSPEDLQAAANRSLPLLHGIATAEIVVAEAARRLAPEHPEMSSLLARSAGIFGEFVAAVQDRRAIIFTLDALPMIAPAQPPQSGGAPGDLSA